VTPSAAELQAALVAELQTNGALTDPVVAAAFRAVPRHHFLPGLPLEDVYRDEAIPTKYSPEGSHPISSSSQPAIMAIMLEQLAVQPGQRLLEIGAGTGYNAALLAHLTGPSGHVTTIDLDEDIVDAAREHLAAAGFSSVEVVLADGALGYPPNAPYDGIILTVGTWDVAPAWYEQLRPGGRLVLPLEVVPGAQKSAALVKPAAPAADGLWLQSVSLRDCGFMALRGQMASPMQHLPLGPDPGLTLTAVEPPQASAEDLYAWLRAGGQAAATGLQVTPERVWSSLNLWLGLHAPDLVTVIANSGLAERGWAPSLLEYSSRHHRNCLSLGLVTATGLCLLGRGPNVPYPEGDGTPFEIYVWAYGPDPSEAAARLHAILRNWQAAGQPGGRGLRLAVYDPAYPLPTVSAQTVIVDKPFTRLVLTYQPPAADQQ
jgi:protein-L-isoaspartate(D-aspartate) O-methyltransferase